jgi:hypothetical protein
MTQNIRRIQRKMGEYFAFADASEVVQTAKDGSQILLIDKKWYWKKSTRYGNDGMRYGPFSSKNAAVEDAKESGWFADSTRADASLAAAKSRANQKKREADKPSNNDPYYEGDHAFHMGKSKNPYSPGSRDHREWQEGYDEANS